MFAETNEDLMQTEDAAHPPVPVDPFAFLVPEDDARNGAASSPGAGTTPWTLRRIAYAVAGVSVEELRAVNMEPVAHALADAALESGTVVRLPAVLGYRGFPYGLAFSLGRVEAQLQQCETMLDTAAATWERAHGAGDLDCLPARKARSPSEAILAEVHAEVLRQLPRVEARLQRRRGKDSRLPLLVESKGVRDAERKVEEVFREAVAGLESFREENKSRMRPGTVLLSSNDITLESLSTQCDERDEFNLGYTHRWEFAVHGIGTKEPRDVWAVLSSQQLVVLLDAVDCATQRDPLTRSKEGFLFIHGVFYIDDRCSSATNAADLSSTIRAGIRHGDDAFVSECDAVAFGRCPVRSATATTFADLDIKMGESCLLRHCGGCDHYFSLAHVCSLRGYPRQERHEYPHRVAKVRSAVRRCLLCQLFPATVVLYEDPLSPESPAYYCAVCFDILHGCDTPEERQSYQKREAKDWGEVYFKAFA